MKLLAYRMSIAHIALFSALSSMVWCGTDKSDKFRSFLLDVEQVTELNEECQNTVIQQKLIIKVLFTLEFARWVHINCPVCLPVCPSVRPSVCPSVRPSVHLSVIFIFTKPCFIIAIPSQTCCNILEALYQNRTCTSNRTVRIKGFADVNHIHPQVHKVQDHREC